VRSLLSVLLLVLSCAGTTQAQPLALLMAETADPGAVSIRVEKVYYDVEGETPAALAAQLGRHGPRVENGRFFSLTEWEVRTEYRWDQRPDGCRLVGLRVRASVQTHMPRWRRTDAAPESLSGAWGRFLAALDWHEHGHRDLAEEAAEAIQKRLSTLRAPTCPRVEARAYGELIDVLNEYEQYNRDYDAATDHGRSQGAVWPPKP